MKVHSLLKVKAERAEIFCGIFPEKKAVGVKKQSSRVASNR